MLKVKSKNYFRVTSREGVGFNVEGPRKEELIALILQMKELFSDSLISPPCLLRTDRQLKTKRGIPAEE